MLTLCVDRLASHSAFKLAVKEKKAQSAAIATGAAAGLASSAAAADGGDDADIVDSLDAPIPPAAESDDEAPSESVAMEQ